MTNFKNLLIGFIFSCLIYSCNSNQDLEIKKENLNNKINELNKRSFNSLSDIDILILDLKNLRSEANEYIEECNKRGIQKDNSYAHNQLNSKIEDLEKIKSQKINEENEKRLNEENKQREEELLQSENQKNNDNKALETERIDQYIKGKISFNELMSEAFIIAKNRYFNSGDGNFRVLCQEIKSQYPSRIEELNFFYMQNQNNLTSKQKNDLSNLIQSMKNLFDNTFRS
jgi:benzoyl-CoA reductase/2-hydroxyglutaryl-CoA dehydratase subunit BcrC/BadD/HgdB